MTARQAWALVVADFLLGASLAFGLARAHADPYCMEDQPCWDCATMGNLRCGPEPTDPAFDAGVYVGGYN